MASLKDDMMIDRSDNYSSDYDDFDSSDSEDISVAIKPQGGGVNSFAEYELRTAASKKVGNKASDFPADIIMRVNMEIKDVAQRHVLPFLPVKSVMKFRAVSKEWNQWIASPLFAYNQNFTFQKLSGYFYQRLEFEGDPTFLSLHSSVNGVPSPSLGFLPENVKVLSFTNGLLLCQGLKDSYYVCNPATKDWKNSLLLNITMDLIQQLFLHLILSLILNHFITWSLQSLFLIIQLSALRFMILNQIHGGALLQTV